MLPSGLPEFVDDKENLARFLTSSKLFNSTIVKPHAFLPNPKDKEASVFRHDTEPRDTLWALGQIAADQRTLHGAGFVTASVVRFAKLEVNTDEPPARYAVIAGWPIKDDPDLQDAVHWELATTLAKNAILLKKL